MRLFDYIQWPPPIQFRWLKKIDYWPQPPLDGNWGSLQRLCLGVTCRTIGDSALLTTLPRKLKAKYPHLKIMTYPRGFNPHVFKHNPYIDGLQYLPDQVFGDASTLGLGHNIQLQEQFFGLEVSRQPKPEFYLSPSERQLGQEQRAQSDLPVGIIHPWAQTRRELQIFEHWKKLVERYQRRVQFWQIGVQGEQKIPGCAQHFLLPRVYGSLRKMMALISAADFFIGLDSGPMHVARAFDRPSLILVNHCDMTDVFEKRRQYAYFLYKNYLHAFLYEENEHAQITGELEGDLALIQAFVEGQISRR